MGIGVTRAVTAVVVATGGSATPVLIGAAIGGGSGAVINGGIATAGVVTSLGTNLLFAGLSEIGQAKTKTGGNTGYNTGYHTNNQIPEGYFQDKAGRWHRPNGQFASNVELGHTKGNEFWRLRDMAEAQGWTQAEFNDFMNNPKFYGWQDIKSNRSHKHELK